MQLQEDRRNISGEPDRKADKQTRKGGKADSSADRDSKGGRQLFQALYRRRLAERKKLDKNRGKTRHRRYTEPPFRR
jgi:hypothetical protein